MLAQLLALLDDAQRARIAAEIRARPSGVFGPDESPPCRRQRSLPRFVARAAHWHGVPHGQTPHRKPPSTGMSAPVTKSDALLARKAAMPAKSSGVPRRPAA